MRLHDYLEFFSRENPERPFAEFGDQCLSYAEANGRANQFARALLGFGLAKGDRFAYLAKNSLDFYLMYLAAAKAGLVPVPLNYRLAPVEWQFIVQDAGAKLIMASEEFRQGVDSIREQLPTIEVYISTSGEAGQDWLSFEALISGQETANLALSIAASDPLYQMYTSGTTGHPKGVVISHFAFTQCLELVNRLHRTEIGTERFLVIPPFFHVAAVVISMAALNQGNAVVIHEDFDPPLVIKTLSEDGITRAGLVPAMLQACIVSVPDIAERTYPTLKTFLYGASPIAESTLRRGMEIFGCDFVQIFGMTETAGMATGLNQEDHVAALTTNPRLLQSAGRAALGTEVRITRDGKEVPRGEIGEITVRGPQVMDRYWNLPEATATAVIDGWLYTGDAATMDEDGYLFIKDRIKDMIVSGAENVYPAEVENALFQHPDINDAAVIGIPDEKWGEAILAFLVTRNSVVLSSEELIEFCRGRLAGYKIPRRYEFVEALPRNASGKVLRRELRDPYWRGADRRVG